MSKNSNDTIYSAKQKKKEKNQQKHSEKAKTRIKTLDKISKSILIYLSCLYKEKFVSRKISPLFN